MKTAVYYVQDKNIFCQRLVGTLTSTYSATGRSELLHPQTKNNFRKLNLLFIMIIILYILGRAVAWWLRHYATNRQVAGSISNGVTGIFQ
jgi:hypothetical protein